jgi:hypothetical protein
MIAILFFLLISPEVIPYIYDIVKLQLCLMN